jgi:hypothetical protein
MIITGYSVQTTLVYLAYEVQLYCLSSASADEENGLHVSDVDSCVITALSKLRGRQVDITSQGLYLNSTLPNL